MISQAHRVLRPGGSIVISTENLASWHNIFALALGWQPFSLTNISSVISGVGNPMALHRGESGQSTPMQHLRIFTIRALVELLESQDFQVLSTLGAGYYPLRKRLAEVACRYDKVHAAFIIVKAIKQD